MLESLLVISAPLTQTVFNTFLKPKFVEIAKKRKRQKLIIDHAFESKFIDYLNESYEKNAVLNTVAFKKKKILLSDVYIPLTIISQESQASSFTLDSISKDLFKKSNKILITDTAGMGKSTLSKRLMISCIEKNFAVPVLIELRRISKDKDLIDEILEQINPINENIDKQFILDLIKRGDFLFFLDGFDEISIAERSLVTEKLQHFISKSSKNKFILTSRPEDSLSSFGDFLNFQIRPLKIEQAFDLLRNYDQNGELAERLIAKIKEPENRDNISEYLDTPLLVSLLFTAFEHKQRIPFKKHIFYRQVFDALYESHDLSKGGSFERNKYSGLGVDEFHRVLRILAYLCLKQNNRIEYSRDELDQLINNSREFCDDLNFKTSDLIKDLLVTVPLFVKDGVYIKWSHKSLQEYFCAQFIYQDSKEKLKQTLLKICYHENNKSFINIIDIYQSIDPKGFEQIVVHDILNKYFDFLNNSYKGFEGEEVFKRQQLEFGHFLVLVHFRFNNNDAKPSDLFKLLRKSNKIAKGIASISVLGMKREESLSFIKAPKIVKPHQIIIELLYSKNCPFTFNGNVELEHQSVDLKLPEKKLCFVSDRINSVLNKTENFKKTNEIIKNHFFRGPETILINKTKAREKLDEINKSILKNNSDSFYDF